MGRKKEKREEGRGEDEKGKLPLFMDSQLYSKLHMNRPTIATMYRPTIATMTYVHEVRVVLHKT